jgi:hypothetical protein
MESDLLDRHLPSRSVVPLRESEDQPADLGAFGCLRGVRDRALMLELRRKDGSVTAFPYAWLERADFDPSQGITLRFGPQKVQIAGRNLNTDLRQSACLFAGIVRHRVPWIQEAERPAAMGADWEAVVIEAISVS